LSLALRRHPDALSAYERRIVEDLSDLLSAKLVVVIGPVKQEVLSGVRTAEHFDRILSKLERVEEWPIESSDYIQAAKFYNTCRAHGIAGTHVDLLICAVATRRAAEVFTTDPDFPRYAAHLPIGLRPLPPR
jgi:predicted nucleic acid-binding protein